MTGTEVSVEAQAHRIAARGRDALVERLRAAYGDAAAAHADLISLDDDRIEAMVQSAADRADGLQWRRALADVAAEELGVSAIEALSHPAVTQAQALVGAPSYEQSLAELIAQPVPPPVAPASNGGATAVEDAPAAVEDAPAAAVTENPAGDDLETVEADDVVLELLPEPDPIEYETQAYDVEASFAGDPVPPPPSNPFAHGPAQAEASPPPPDEEETAMTIPAVHLGGVANLPTKREGLMVRLSADGLDILHGERDIIGRLIWDEIEALEVPHLRMRRRQKQLRARLVVRTPHGDASFDVPEVSGDELRDRVEPFMRLYGGS